MNKRNLMLSAATAALLAGPAFATATCTTVTTANPDCVTTATTTALTTGAADTGGALETASIGTANVGSIFIGASPSAVAISTTNVGAITVNSNSYVYSDGAIKNTGVSTATGILVDVFANPNASGLSFTNVAGTTTVTGAGIYMDSTSSIDLSGSGTNKHGIWLSTANGDGTYTGDITFISGSKMNIVGDSSYGVLISPTSTTTTGAIGATLKGDLSFSGTFTMNQMTAKSTTASGLYGLLMEGKVIGNISLPGTMSIIGEGATGMSIQGSGVTGSISIGGTLATIGESSSSISSSTSYYTNTSKTVYPEAGSALVVGASVGNGIAILGPSSSATSVTAASVTSAGTSTYPTIVISPGLNTLYTSAEPQTAPMTIGVYTTDGTTAGGDINDPGFSFYNRGTISQTQVNTNESTMAIKIAGASYKLPTILTGGFLNSGTIGTSAVTTGTTADPNSASAIYIGSNTCLDTCTFDVTTGKYYTSGTWTDTSLASKSSTDQYAFVNSGAITAAVSGTRGGTAKTIYIAANASVPSLFNSGTISATAATGDTTITNPLQAVAIEDYSGSLTSIYNTGTISASTTTLDSDAQVATAIDLHGIVGVNGTPAGSGVVIDDYSTSTGSATISACNVSSSTCSTYGTAINFGSGDNQILNIVGNSSHAATVTGNVIYGTGSSGGGGDELNIGAYGILNGIVTSYKNFGVAVDVANEGLLELQNDTTSLNASTFHIAGYGTISLGVSESLSRAGLASVVAGTSANIDPNAILKVTYNSFVPQGSDSFVVITAPHGQLNVPNRASYNATLGTPMGTGTGTMPFLFHSAGLSICRGGNTSCPITDSTLDALVLQVVPKDATGLGLTAGSYANTPLPIKGGGTSTIFDLANTALANDDTLGAAMINGIHNAAEAQKAYNAFAPNVTGGSRAIVVSITDQGTGVVGARLRMLNLYGKQEGGTTLWGQEFVQMIKDPGQGATDPNTNTKLQSGFKDHGFGFVLGIDGGTPKYGWYGGAFTFYAGDVGELARDSHENEQWYLLSGYSAWRGKGLYFDSKLDVGYGHIDGKRFINLQIINPQTGTTSTYTREADNKHPGTMISGGFTTGGIFSYGAATLSPQISVDGLLMREEGYTENNPGTIAACTLTSNKCDGFDLKVNPYYAKSLRVFLGGNVRYDLDLWDFYLQPEAHAGFRYDVFNDPVKLKAAFAYADQTGGTAGPGTQFTMTGPDPAQGNIVVGGSLAATTDAWTLGFNFDFVKGSNGLLEEVGTINLLGRI